MWSSGSCRGCSSHTSCSSSYWAVAKPRVGFQRPSTTPAGERCATTKTNGCGTRGSTLPGRDRLVGRGLEQGAVVLFEPRQHGIVIVTVLDAEQQTGLLLGRKQSVGPILNQIILHLEPEQPVRVFDIAP